MERLCPGCGLAMPHRPEAVNGGYYNASPECWTLYTEVLAREYGNAVVFGQAHQLSVDAYAAQHAGGPHPDKSVCVHLVGLHLVLDRGVAPMSVPPLQQRLASSVSEWPHFEPPEDRGGLTIFDVALSGTPIEHIESSRRWAAAVWRSWKAQHAAIARLAADAGITDAGSAPPRPS